MIEYYDSAFKPSRYLLWLTGMRPFKNHIKPMILFFVAIETLLNTLTVISFLYDKTFMDGVDIIVTEFYNVNVILRLVTFIHYEKEFQSIYRDMEKLWPITDPKLHAILNYLKYFQNFLVFQTLTFTMAVWANGYFTGESSLHIHRPEMVPEILFAIFIVDGYYLLMVCVWIGFDLVFLTLTTILIIQYDILNSSLRDYVTGNGQQNRAIQICMKQSTLLKRITDRINTIFGPMLLIYMWLIVIALGMLMYIIYERNGNPMDCMKYFIIIVAIVIEIFVYFVAPAQILTNEINKIFDEIYCTNWYDCSMPVKKSLLMILTRQKTDAVITANKKLVELNYKTCTSMFRTCYSVFTFLVHMKNFRSKHDN